VSDNTNAIVSPADFRFEPAEDLSDLGGAASRFNHNVAAITLLKLSRVQPKTHTPFIPSGFTACSAVSRFG
jgi:hypothetical protein